VFAFTFYLMTLLIIASAGYVVLTRNLVRAGFALMITFFGVAGLYIQLAADFIAVTQVLVYIGGILVLILFAIMLTTHLADAKHSNPVMNRTGGVLVGIFLFYVLASAVLKTKWATSGEVVYEPSITMLGDSLLTTYLLPFEVASVALLAVLVGATKLARKEIKED